MGSGIMAHFANAGVDVVMLDIVPPGLSDADRKNPAKRNQFSAGGLKGALKAKPAAFFHPNYAKRVTIGNRSSQGMRPGDRGDHREHRHQAQPARKAREYAR
jgi:hypothetical protein